MVMPCKHAQCCDACLHALYILRKYVYLRFMRSAEENVYQLSHALKFCSECINAHVNEHVNRIAVFIGFIETELSEYGFNQMKMSACKGMIYGHYGQKRNPQTS